MTSPVHINLNDSSTTMSFVMPSKYNMNELPNPISSNIVLEKSLKKTVAVKKLVVMLHQKGLIVKLMSLKKY